jgi:DNA-binding SARP family transcriptional activator
MGLEFRILGPLEVEDDRRLLDLGGDRPRAVLGFLLLHPNQLISSDRLLETLWGKEASSGARNSLQSTVSRLRQVLAAGRGRETAPERLISRSRSYRLLVEPDELDSLRFERLVGEGRRLLEDGGADPVAISGALRESLSLWRGRVLEDLRHERLDDAAIARLELLRRGAVEAKAKADLRAGRAEDAIPELQSELVDDPYNERLRSQLMLALYQVGRATQAVDVYFDFAQMLEEQRGMRPGPELYQLNQDIQRRQVQFDPAPSRTLPAGPPVAAIAKSPMMAASPPKESQPLPSEIFVGRETEMLRLRDALAASRSGLGRLVLIAGEMGIGKTHLARRIALEAEAVGVDALWGRVWEEQGAPIYWPWLMIVRQLLERRDGDWLRQRLGADAAVVAQVITDVAEQLPDLPEPPQLEPMQDRFRLFDSFTRFLKRAVSDQPMVLVLDDLHRADVSSIMLLRFLSRELGDARLLIVATYRDSRGDQTEDFVRALAELTREPGTSRLTLHGFDLNEVTSFVRQTTSTTVSGELIGKLHRRTGGNPLFLREIVLPLNEGRSVDDFEQEIETFVPQGVQEAIERRFAYIPEQMRDTLDKAAVIGQQFTLEVLAEVARIDHAKLRELLDEAIALGFVAPAIGLTENRFRFTHLLICDTLYDRLTSARRAAAHLRVAEALEEVYAGDLDARYIELAHHYSRAGTEAASVRSLQYLQLAGEQAVARLAYEEAVGLLGSALQQPTDRTRRCDLLLALADAQMKAGTSKLARATYLQAADTAKALGDNARFARAALGFGSHLSDFGLVNQQLIELLEEAAAQVGDDALALRARVLGRLAEALYWVDPAQRPGVADERAELSAEAVALARRADDPDALAVALHGRWYGTWRPETAEERRQLAVELHKAAIAAGNWQMALVGRMWSVFTALELGDVSAADAEIKAYLVEVEGLRQPYLLALPRLWEATRAMMQGRFSTAEDLNRQALALGERAPEATLIENAVTLQQWFLDDERGRREALESAIEGFSDRFPSFPSWRLPLALMRLAAGDPGTARAELDRFAAKGFGSLRHDANWLATMTLLAEICTALKAKDYAAELYELLTPYSAHCVVIGYAAVCRSAVSLQLGQLAALLCRWDAADQYFSAALTANRRISARPALTHTRYRYALALLTRDRGDDRVRARELLSSAAQDAAELDMRELAREIAAALETCR